MANLSTTQVNAILGKTDASSIVSASNKSTKANQATTDRGTRIVSGHEGFDKNSFLKILSAQLSNLDPTANQDSTAYVTQMAQFTSMEQMYNLNETMTTSSYQQLIGKGVTVDVPDANGNAYTGIVRGVSKDAKGTYLSVEVNENGKNVYKVFDAKKLTSVLGIQDNTNSNMLINSDFSAASSLASNEKNKVIISDTDEKGNPVVIKGTIKGAFIDNGSVKIRVDVFDDNGSPTGKMKVYPYGYVYKAGDLTEEDMNVKPEDIISSNDFEAAKALATNTKNRALINDTDLQGNKIYVKATIKEAFMADGKVKINVELLGDDGQPTGDKRQYMYSDVYKAGNLTDEEMNAKPVKSLNNTTDIEAENKILQTIQHS